MELEKLAVAECFETCDAVYKSVYAPNISLLTGYVRKISMQPTELWLSYTSMNALEADSVEVESPEVEEPPAVNGFVRYVEAVSAEPLEYWLCPNCEVEFPSVNEASFEQESTENANCTWPEPEADVYSVTASIHRVLRKPDSFWIISHHGVGQVIEKSVELNSLLCVPDRPDISAVSNDELSQLGIAYCSDSWLRQSSSAVHSDQTEVVVNVVNGTSFSFEFKSAVRGCTVGKDVVDYSDGAYFASLTSKPVDYWLCIGNQKVTCI